MIKINKTIETYMLELHRNNIGHFSEHGAMSCDEYDFSLVYLNNEIYLAHKSEFEYSGYLCRLKEPINYVK